MPRSTGKDRLTSSLSRPRRPPPPPGILLAMLVCLVALLLYQREYVVLVLVGLGVAAYGFLRRPPD